MAPAAENGRAIVEAAAAVANANPNKIDAYLHREVGYDATVDPATGEVTATATVVLRNDAPAGLSNYVAGNTIPGVPGGVNRTFLSIYTPLSVGEAMLGGLPLGIERQVEYGLNRAGAFVDIPQFGSRTVTFVLRGAVDLSTGYRHPSETEVDAPAVSFELRGDALVVAPPESLRTGPSP